MIASRRNFLFTGASFLAAPSIIRVASLMPVSVLAIPDVSRSTLHVRLTSRYLDAGTAKLEEILLAPGAKPFDFFVFPRLDHLTQTLDLRHLPCDLSHPTVTNAQA